MEAPEPGPHRFCTKLYAAVRACMQESGRRATARLFESRASVSASYAAGSRPGRRVG